MNILSADVWVEIPEDEYIEFVEYITDQYLKNSQALNNYGVSMNITVVSKNFANNIKKILDFNYEEIQFENINMTKGSSSIINACWELLKIKFTKKLKEIFNADIFEVYYEEEMSEYGYNDWNNFLNYLESSNKLILMKTDKFAFCYDLDHKFKLDNVI